MPLKLTTKVRKNYRLTTARSSNQAWLKFTIKRTSYKQRLVVTAIAFIILNTVLMWGVRQQLPLGEKSSNLLILAGLILSLCLLRRPPVESFTVYRNYGVQVTKVKGLIIFPDGWNNKWLAQAKFIPRDQILDIVINEGFVRGFQVIFYLAVIVKESKKLELLFSTTRPILEDQKLIYNMSRDCLYSEKKQFHA